jgi:hypothetical protein
MWQWVDEDDLPHGVMDPATSSPDLLTDVLNYNFQQRYTGNRAPLGLYLHAGQSAFEGRPEALRAFIEEAITMPDVWMITMRGLAEWMREPVPASKIAAWFANGCDRGLCRGTTGTSIESLPETVSPTEGYPNPTSSTVTLVYDNAEPGLLTLEVLNVLGRVVYQEQRTERAGRLHLTVPLQEQAPGLYLYRLRGGQHVLFHGTVIKRR